MASVAVIVKTPVPEVVDVPERRPELGARVKAGAPGGRVPDVTANV